MPNTEAVSPCEVTRVTQSPCLIGRNRRGLWVVNDPRGMRGGLFFDRLEAFRFATQGSDGPCLAVVVSYPLELNLGFEGGS